MDAIGLGGFLANATYTILITVIFIGAVFFGFTNKRILPIWLSLLLNVLFFLYFLGSRYYYASFFTVLIWPLINIYLIINYRTKKK
jgi:hypothetical protein